MSAKQKKEPWRDSPTAWFVTLERARKDGDADLAAKAERELRRLGVWVDFATTARKGATDGE